MYVIKDHEGNTVFHGVAQEICEALQCYLEDVFGFHPMLQENEDEGYLEIYLHNLLKISVEPAN